MSFAGLLPGDRKFLSKEQKRRDEKKKKKKRNQLKIKTSETPPNEGQDTTNNGKQKKPKYSKGEVAKNLGNALSKTGSKISKAQSEASSSVQTMKDKNRAERNKKTKGYRYGA